MGSKEILDQALIYAEKMGWHIHPCRKDKKPYLNDWPHKATNDPAKIKEWWRKWPDASIGCKCGPDSKIWVVDVDLPDGPETIKRLQKDYGDLPTTLKQKTGSGGLQIFFSYNGSEIRNSSRKLGPGIDVRGNGGYIILPPSGHPAGGKYEWMKKVKVAEPPGWLKQLAQEPETTYRPQQNETGLYGKRALADEIVKLSMAGEGTRNDTLNQCAFNLGQLIAGGELEHDHVFYSLLATAQTVGLKPGEAKATIESGIKGGIKYPRSAPENGDIQYDLSNEQNEQNEHFDNQSAKSASMSIDEHVMSKNEHPMSMETKPSPHNLKAAIFEFIKNSTGSFTTRDIDTEFGLTTRREKNTRSQALYMARNSYLIKKDKRAAGKYHIINDDMEWIDLDAEEPEAFPISLPFDLHEYVKIPPKAIIILAGSSNAGKTAFILNTLRLNLKQKYPLLYLMSEMGSGEFKSRIKSFQEPIAKWKKIKAASKSYDFDGAVQKHNPDGLTCVDYLEEIEGEYFKIASSIRDIYDSIGNGVAFIAIQKKSDSQFARGGEATQEKARLYMTLDYLATEDHAIVCALKVMKAKSFINKNLVNHELHFRLTRGAQIEALTDWMPSSKVNRAQMAARYEAGVDNKPEDDAECVWFKTDKGNLKRVTFQDAEKWAENFTEIDVTSELERISQDSFKKPFLKDSGWFHQLAGILRKKNGGN